MHKNQKYREFVTYWIEYHKNFVKESTYANYMNIVDNHLIRDFGEKHLWEFNKTLLQDYVILKLTNGSINESPLALKSVRDIMVVLKMSLRHAFTYDYIDSFDLSVRYPSKSVNNIPVSISNNELQIIIQSIKTSNDRRDLGILLALFTGLRIGEICALRYSDISNDKKSINISRTLQRIYTKKTKTKIIETTPKTASSYRSIPISKEVIDIFTSDTPVEPSNYILSNSNKPVEPRILRKRFTHLLSKSNLQHYTFHMLRHTFASKCVEAQIDPKTISVILGHSNISTTLNLYVHPSETQKQKAIDNMSNFILQ